MCIFTYDQREEKYVEVNDIDDIQAVHKMIHKEAIWSGKPYYYVVKLPKFSDEIPDAFYPLPLVYATKDEQEKAAKEAGKDIPEERILIMTRGLISELICSGPLRARKMPKWKIPVAYRDLISAAMSSADGYDYNIGDSYIAEILHHRGVDTLMSIVEDAGYSLFIGVPEYAIRFEAKDLVAYQLADPAGHEAVCLKFAAACCARRANDVGPGTDPSHFPVVEAFIDSLRDWLEEIIFR